MYHRTSPFDPLPVSKSLSNIDEVSQQQLRTSQAHLLTSLASLGVQIWQVGEQRRSNDLLAELATYERERRHSPKCPLCKTSLIDAVRICPGCHRDLFCPYFTANGRRWFFPVVPEEVPQTIRSLSDQLTKFNADIAEAQRLIKLMNEELIQDKPSPHTYLLAASYWRDRWLPLSLLCVPALILSLMFGLFGFLAATQTGVVFPWQTDNFASNFSLLITWLGLSTGLILWFFFFRELLTCNFSDEADRASRVVSNYRALEPRRLAVIQELKAAKANSEVIAQWLTEALGAVKSVAR